MRVSIAVFLMFVFSVSVNAQRRVDTTMKIGKVGYRIVTSNKSPDQNALTITPVGFDKEAREASLLMKGRVVKAEVDDLNNDGCPDLVIYVMSPGKQERVSVFGITSQKNTMMAPIIFPDVYDDQKLRDGYNGHDQFILMEGMLVHRFPLYNMADSTPTGMIRQVQYRVVPGDRDELKFKVVRVYDFAKQ